MYNKDNTREADEIFSRILSEMERQGRKYAELTEYLELPRGTFSSWKAGRSRNFCEHIGAIADFLGVSAEYLINGNIEGKLVENSKEQQLLNYFRKLNVEKQNAVLQNINGWRNRMWDIRFSARVSHDNRCSLFKGFAIGSDCNGI